MANGDADPFKLDSLWDIDTDVFDSLPATIKNESIREVAEAFVGNLRRSATITTVMPMLIGLAAECQQHQCTACYEIVGKPNPDISKIDSVKHAKIVDRVNQLFSESRACNTPEERLATHWNAGSKLLRDALASSTYMARENVDTILSTAILTAWTAFETMAGDLWVAAINKHPLCLAELKGFPRRIELAAKNKEVKPPSNSGANESKQFDLKDLHKITLGSYDLHDKMGDLLQSRFQFTKLAGIREAYSSAFYEGFNRARPGRIDGALKNNSLDVLSLVRNLIVHDAGVADDTYPKDSRGIADAPKLSKGDRLQLNGEVVASIINPATACAVELVSAVDSWLTIAGANHGRSSDEADESAT